MDNLDRLIYEKNLKALNGRDVDHPYYLDAHRNVEYFQCHKCNKNHYPEEYIIVYNCCCFGEYLQPCRSCDPDWTQKCVDEYNIGHVKVRDLSIAQGHKPVLL